DVRVRDVHEEVMRRLLPPVRLLLLPVPRAAHGEVRAGRMRDHQVPAIAEVLPNVAHLVVVVAVFGRHDVARPGVVPQRSKGPANGSAELACDQDSRAFTSWVALGARARAAMAMKSHARRACQSRMPSSLSWPLPDMPASAIDSSAARSSSRSCCSAVRAERAFAFARSKAPLLSYSLFSDAWWARSSSSAGSASSGVVIAVLHGMP